MLEAIRTIFTARLADPSTWGNAHAIDHLLVAGLIAATFAVCIYITIKS